MNISSKIANVQCSIVIFHFGLLTRAHYRLAEVIGQPVVIVVVFLANVFLQFAGWIPWNIPSHSPGFCVRTGIINRCFVVQRALIRA